MNRNQVRRLLALLCSTMPLFAACDESASTLDSGDSGVDETGVAARTMLGVSITTIGAGNAGSLALRSDGTVWAWGTNSAGELGDGTTLDRSAPVLVLGLPGNPVTSVSEGLSAYSLAQRADGSLWAWGANTWGQLGIGLNGGQSAPSRVVDGGGPLTGVTASSAASTHGLAVANGTVVAWGINASGQLGDGTAIYSRNRAAAVKLQDGGGPLTGAVAVAGGSAHSLALMADGTVQAWGGNVSGQLGDGTLDDRNLAAPVAGLTNIKALAAAYRSSLALKDDGTVWAWGANTYGQLGDGTTTERHTPVQVKVLVNGAAVPFTNVVAIAEGYQFSLALKDDGTVWAWGSNGSGRLGDGTTMNRYRPVQVKVQVNGQLVPLTGVTAVAAGQSHALAQTEDATVLSWGANTNGQLGDGTTTERHTAALSGFNVGASWPMPNPASTGLMNPASYTSMSGQVQDDVTGLVWEQPSLGCANGCTRAQAAVYCAGLTLGGESDWRLPARLELISIVDDTQHAPASDPDAFPGASSSYLWSASPMIDIPDNAFVVGGAEGDTSYGQGDSQFSARCVRGSAGVPANVYAVEGDGTVLDTGTGLTWQQAAPAQTYSLGDAIDYCANNTAGLPGAGWRLPSMKELQSIVDDSRTLPSIDPNAFPGTQYDLGFWSATPTAWVPGYAWRVRFNHGKAEHSPVDTALRVRCVR
jgi:alpha-tubulin suppressor-like RCC1 family protein